MFYNQVSKALIEEIVHMSQACAIIDLTMGAGTWAAVALEQGLPYFGVALTELHYQEALARLKVEAGIAENPRGLCLRGVCVCLLSKSLCAMPPASK